MVYLKSVRPELWLGAAYKLVVVHHVCSVIVPQGACFLIVIARVLNKQQSIYYIFFFQETFWLDF